ncbi:hypothetical protein PUN28_015353 [Cardiocondyla obscurior]|uniref:Uncharacterized protein n=1 Tax=Cardiocondyla obscurior TaxID=286306 RepID=A0AAW2ESP5_9HYME
MPPRIRKVPGVINEPSPRSLSARSGTRSRGIKRVLIRGPTDSLGLSQRATRGSRDACVVPSQCPLCRGERTHEEGPDPSRHRRKVDSVLMRLDSAEDSPGAYIKLKADATGYCVASPVPAVIQYRGIR